MNRIKGILRNANARQTRRNIVESANYYLDLWADYGNPEHFEEALDILNRER